MSSRGISGLSSGITDLYGESCGIVVVGASGAGKSSLLALLRNTLSGFSEIEFPVRLTTRAPRRDDSPLENCSVDPLYLDALVESDELLLRWEKRITPDHGEFYAFKRTASPLVVMGGNDELITNRASIRPDKDILNMLVKIAVICDPNVRATRLLRRSPELRQARDELQTRLSSTPTDVLEMCEVIIDNTEGFDEAEVKAIADFAIALSKNRAAGW
jgi:ribose 1,5-bisphosphokinase PhnN